MHMGTMEIVTVVLVFIAGSSGLALGVIQARTGRPLMRLLLAPFVFLGLYVLRRQRG